MNVLSYVIFGKPNPEAKDSFWDSIPFLIIVNSLLMEGFVMRFHLHPEVCDTPQAEKLRQMPVEIVVVNRPYKGTQPTAWRMMPLWDDKVDYLFCRDLDAVPTSNEIRAVRFFMRTGHIIHGIRSYHLHTTPLLAGLCGFNCRVLRNEFFFPPSYNDYEAVGNNNTECPDWVWGCDQEILRRFFFGTGRKYLERHTVDTPLRTAPPTLSGYNPLQFPVEEYEKVDISDLNQTALRVCDNKAHFEGEALHADVDMLNTVLNIDCPMAKKVREVYCG